MLRCGRRVVMPTPTESWRLLPTLSFTMFSHRLTVRAQTNIPASAGISSTSSERRLSRLTRA